MTFKSTKRLTLGSCAFRQPNAAFNRKDAGSNSKRCSFMHGYRLSAKFWFGCSSLDDKNWVQDFGGFGPIKDLFKYQFDHTTCLAASDPLLPEFQKIHDLGGLDLRIMPSGTGIERIAEWCFHQMNEFVTTQSAGRVWVEKIEVFEHEDNSAIYEPISSSNQPEQTNTTLLCEPVVAAQAPVAPAVTMPEPIQTPPHQSTAAHVGPRTTTGNYRGLFSGTNWG